MKYEINQRTALLATLLSGSAAVPSGLAAQEFAAVVSPPRFEVSLTSGEQNRQVVEITNASAQAATYHISTADWSLAPDGGVSFVSELAPDSCRPWVALERREIEVPAGGRFRFRFDIEPPAGIAARECRFALMIEGDAAAVQATGGLAVPISGRIGVIVYAAVGDVAPNLQIVPAGVVDVGGSAKPAVTVSNSGTAHGRLTGFLSGTDANGRTLDFTPSSLPILPGESRTLTFDASDGSTVVSAIAYPVRIRGAIEWGNGMRTEFDHLYAR